MFHGGMKYCTEMLTFSTEVQNIPLRGVNIPRRCQSFNRGAELLHGGMKYFGEGVQYSAEV